MDMVAQNYKEAITRLGVDNQLRTCGYIIWFPAFLQQVMATSLAVC
jgi:hypothetical protein